eukprot:COSAG01_NODE_5612_length_4145_cov_11.062531_4_plen_141_part_00
MARATSLALVAALCLTGGRAVPSPAADAILASRLQKISKAEVRCARHSYTGNLGRHCAPGPECAPRSPRPQLYALMKLLDDDGSGQVRDISLLHGEHKLCEGSLGNSRLSLRWRLNAAFCAVPLSALCDAPWVCSWGRTN